MSVGKNKSTYESTGRGFDINHNFIRNTRGVFMTVKDFTLTDSDLDSEDYLRDAFNNNEIFPLHLVTDVIPGNEEPLYIDSQQDYSYQGKKGKYRHKLRFEWDLAYHQIIESYSETDLYVIYYDSDRKLIMTETSEGSGVYRGIKTNRLILEKPNLFTNGSEIAYSDLDIELYDTKELTELGYVRQVDWLPQMIDKLFVRVKPVSVGSDYLNFTVKYNSSEVTGLTSSDITINDSTSGEITGILLSYSSGIYQATNFSNPISSGCLTVNSSGYLGKAKYRVTTFVYVTEGFDLLDGTGFDLLDGTGFDLLDVA